MTHEEMAAKAAEILSKKCQTKLHARDLEYYSYPAVFGSTAGPFGGVGGQMITPFQVQAFVWERSAALFCIGKFWKTEDNLHLGPRPKSMELSFSVDAGRITIGFPSGMKNSDLIGAVRDVLAMMEAPEVPIQEEL